MPEYRLSQRRFRGCNHLYCASQSGFRITIPKMRVLDCSAKCSDDGQPLALAVLALLPLWPGVAARNARALALAFLLGAMTMSLWVRLDPPAPSRAVYSDSKK